MAQAKVGRRAFGVLPSGADQGTLTFGNVSSVFRKAVDARALRLITALSSYFGTEPAASDVVRDMGPEGRPAIQAFAQSFPTASKRCQDQMLQCLWGLQPSVSDLNWLVQSDDPHLVFAGYEAAKDTIKPEERAIAKQRVDAALAKATDPHDVYEGRILSANIGPGQ